MHGPCVCVRLGVCAYDIGTYANGVSATGFLRARIKYNGIRKFV